MPTPTPTSTGRTSDRPEIAYLFERFPAFTQTFCAREVAEVNRQGLRMPVYSIRRPREPAPNDVSLAGVNVHQLPDTNRLDYKIEVRLRSLGHRRLRGEEERPDKHRYHEALYLGARLRRGAIRHLHAHFAGLAARTAWWTWRLYGVPFSLTTHAQDMFNPKPGQRLPLETLVRDAQFVVTETDHSAAFLRARVPAAAERILRVYNGLDLSRFRKARPADGPVRLLAVGRLIEKKGFSYLLAAVRQLLSDGCPLVCDIVGTGPEEVRLAEEVGRADLRGHVRLLGAKTQDQIVDLLAGASVFVLPAVHDRHGDSDNLPTVIAEAMASGLPVVSTRVAGIPEMIAPGQNGFLAEERDVGSLTAHLRTLVADPALRATFGEASRRLAQERFDLRATAAQLREIFVTRALGSTGA